MKSSLQLKPDDVETQLLLGQLYGLNHDSAKAEAEFKAAQKIDANSEEVVLNMARLYTEQGESQRASDMLNGIPVDDRTSRIEYALGDSYDQLKKPRRRLRRTGGRSIWNRTIWMRSAGWRMRCWSTGNWTRRRRF